MDTIDFSSAIDYRYRQSLEELIFFNQGQAGYAKTIEEIVNKYGSPVIKEHQGLLRIELSVATPLQTICAFDTSDGERRLAGAVIFLPENQQALTILHIALHPDYFSQGLRGNSMLAFRLVSEVRKAAKSIKGIKEVILLYAGTEGRMLKIPV